VKGEALDTFVELLGKHFEQSAPAPMLTGSIAKTYADGFARASNVPGVTTRLASRASDTDLAEGRPGMLVTTSEAWLAHKELHQEIFGPSTVIVRCESGADMIACAGALEGSLTAAVHGDSEELREQRELLGILQNKAGRLLFNSYPTGLEVGYATHHGGPYPATTDSRFTSVGEASIYRFARPVCYQNFLDYALPAELRNANPLGIWRTVDGKLTKDPIA
jgi:NADP-dependent aldehyde dehydrogenase